MSIFKELDLTIDEIQLKKIRAIRKGKLVRTLSRPPAGYKKVLTPSGSRKKKEAAKRGVAFEPSPSDYRVVRIRGDEEIKLKRRSRRAERTKKTKKRQITRKRKISMRRRKSAGLK